MKLDMKKVQSQQNDEDQQQLIGNAEKQKNTIQPKNTLQTASSNQFDDTDESSEGD